MTRNVSLLLVLAASWSLGLGCTKTPDEPATPATPEAPAVDTHKEAAAKPAHGDDHGLPWIKDDFAAARTRSQADSKPLVIDLWAPWCHTCMSMKKFVLPHERITKRGDDFVWLALDTDKPKNADAMKSLPLAVWPTFYVLAPDGGVLARHVGSATVEQFVGFLGRAEAAAKAGAGESPFAVAMKGGDAKRATGDLVGAADEYEAALKVGTEDPGRFAAGVSLVEALYKAGEYDRCATAGAARLDDMKNAHSASAADFTYFTIACSKKAERKDHPKLLDRAAAPDGPLRTLLADAKAELSVDDRAETIRILRDVEDERGNKDEAKKLAEQQRKVLDEAVAKLDDPHAVMTFHWPRAEVYTYLGKGAELIGDLEASAKALPDEYEPVYRLAWVLQQVGRNDDAVPHAEAAVRLTYGPRRARAYAILADVHHARGDTEAEKKARAALVGHLESLPAHQQKPEAIEAAKKALAALADQAKE